MALGSNRTRFLDYVRTGRGNMFCSPQIGAGAGFDARLRGKEWVTEVTLTDTKAVCSRFDMVPLYNAGLPDLTRLTPGFTWEVTAAEVDEKGRRVTERTFRTPVGELGNRTVEERRRGATQTRYPVEEEPELAVLSAWLDALLEAADMDAIRQGVAQLRDEVGGDEALSIQWAMQPYELLCFPDTMHTAILAAECPELFRALMDKILRLDERLLDAVAAGGSDFVFLGGPGSEMISPRYYEDYLIPYSRIVTEMAHAKGLLVYTHICSPIEPMLTLGCYNRMGIDLFETLSEPPVGNVRSLSDAFDKLSPDICTRGNIGLDLLLEATPAQVGEKSLSILETASKAGRKHILAASDYLFHDIPEENVRAMCDAVRQFHGIS